MENGNNAIGLGTGNGSWHLGMYIEDIHVTPEYAQELLDKHNTHNRDTNSIHVNYLASQMASGAWIEKSGLAIKFDTNMQMVDGQQRLRAIIMSGISENLLSISNVDEKAFEILDTQRTRTAADSFKIKGYQYHVQLAALTKRYLLLTRDLLDYNISSKKQRITPSIQLAEYEGDKEFYDDILLRGIKLNISANVLTTTDYAGFMAYLIKYRKHDAQKVYFFFNQFASIEKCEYEIIDEVRRRLNNARNSNRTIKTKKYIKRAGLSDSLKTSYIAIAWNAYITGKKNSEGIRFEDGEHFL